MVTACCGATKVIMPSCLVGEQGLGARKKEKIILALIKGADSQKKIAGEFETSEATVSRLKAEILDLDLRQLSSRIRLLEKNLNSGKAINTTPKKTPRRPKSAGAVSSQQTLQRNFNRLRYYRWLKIRLNSRLKHFPAMVLWQIICRKDRFEFILRS